MDYLGIDIGGTDVKIGIVDACGEVLLSAKYPVNMDHYKLPFMDAVMNGVSMFLSDKEIDLSQIKGVGVSATGQIDKDSGVVIGSGGSVPGYCGSRIKERIEAALHLPCSVLNDADCMVLAESWIGAAKGYQNVVAFTIGTGIGGGIIANNTLLTGRNGIAGEIGHMILHQQGELCGCGNRGCFERYASTSALIRRIHTRYPARSIMNGMEVFQCIKKGDQEIQIVVNEWIEDIAAGCVSLVHIFNPEIIVIGGGVSNEREYLIEPLRKKIKEKAMPMFAKDLEIKQAKLGNTAGIVGAVYHFINQ